MEPKNITNSNKNQNKSGGIIIRKITSPQQQQQQVLQQQQQNQINNTHNNIQQLSSQQSLSRNNINSNSSRSSVQSLSGDQFGQNSKKRKFSYPETQAQLEKIYDYKQQNAKRMKPNSIGSSYSNENSADIINQAHSSPQSSSQIKPQYQSQNQQNKIIHNPKLFINNLNIISSNINNNINNNNNIALSNNNSISATNIIQRRVSNHSSESIDVDKLQEYIDITESPQNINNYNSNNKSRSMSISSNLLKQIDEQIENEEDNNNDDEEDELDLNDDLLDSPIKQIEQKNSPQQKTLQQQENKGLSDIINISINNSIQQNPIILNNDQNNSNSIQSISNEEFKQSMINAKVKDEFYLNRCFYIRKMYQQNAFSIQMELELAPPMDQNGVPLNNQKQSLCNLNFRLNLIGTWAKRLYVEEGDLVRVIGNFCSENQYCLTLDDNELDLTINKASMIIVEPYIMIPCTSIVKAFPCARNAMLSHQFKGLNTDINYALVLGNTIHGVFQAILQTMDFKKDSLQKMIKEAIQDQLLYLFFLQKTQEEVERDVERGVNNITKWLNMVFRGDFNQYGIKYRKFIAAEQEFNTNTYGIKGNIDSTIIIEDKQGNVKSTALEIKTGKNKSNAYRGQVLLYSLLISERFVNSNPENILLYIMDNDISNGFQYIKQSKIELDNIIMGRNELAKWQKQMNTNTINKTTTAYSLQNHSKNINFQDIKSIGEYENLTKDQQRKFDNDIEQMDFIRYPPMIKQTQECKYCFARNVCSITALSIEPKEHRKEPAGQFPTFQDMEKTLRNEVKQYYKKFIECIQLEQNIETDRSQKNQTRQSFQRESGLRLCSVESNNKGGCIVTLEKPCSSNGEDGAGNDTLTESSFVNLYTQGNITFSKGFLISREIDFKSKPQTPIHNPNDDLVYANDEQIKKQQQYNINNHDDDSNVSVIQIDTSNSNNNNNNIIKGDQQQQNAQDCEMEVKMQDIDKYFTQWLVYTIEFAHLMPQNFSVDALGGRDPYQRIDENNNNDKQSAVVQWTIETEPFSNFSYSMMRSNVLALCTDSRFDSLQELIVLNKQPYDIPDKHIVMVHQKFQKQMEMLNTDQKLAICKSILCQDYHLIHGVPGSGKTKTLVTLINILASMNKKILLVNFSNSSVDNALVSLKESGFEKFVRLSSNASSVDQRIRDKVVQSSMFKSMDQIKEFVENTNVFGMTCLSMNNPILLSVQKFDYCIFDDATQISEPLALGPIIMSSKFVMAGDFNQYGIQCKSFIAERKGMGKSLFERLCKQQPQNVTSLKMQYRVNKDIMELANKVIYENQMISHNDSVSKLQIEYHPQVSQGQQQLNQTPNWLLQTRQSTVKFLQTDSLIQQIPLDLRANKLKTQNFIELEILKQILIDIQQNVTDIQKQRIAIITATQEHSNYLSKQLKQQQSQIESQSFNGNIEQEASSINIDNKQALNLKQPVLKYDIITSVDRVNQNLQCDIMIFSCGLWCSGGSNEQQCQNYQYDDQVQINNNNNNINNNIEELKSSIQDCNLLKDFSKVKSTTNNNTSQSQQQQQSQNINNSSGISSISVIKDIKKLNLVLTTPKKKLIIIGSKENLKKQKQLYKVLMACKMKGWYTDLQANEQSIISSLQNEYQQYLKIQDDKIQN